MIQQLVDFMSLFLSREMQIRNDETTIIAWDATLPPQGLKCSKITTRLPVLVRARNTGASGLRSKATAALS
jgi:hypothetical protein